MYKGKLVHPAYMSAKCPGARKVSVDKASANTGNSSAMREKWSERTITAILVLSLSHHEANVELAVAIRPCTLREAWSH